MAKYKPDLCAKLIEHMEKGLSFVSFGAIAGVSEVTLHEWVKKNPEFAEAKQLAEMKSLLYWEVTGQQGMRGKIPGFIPAVWIFNMKARFKKYGYRDDGLFRSPDEDAEENLAKAATAELLKVVKGGKSGK